MNLSEFTLAKGARIGTPSTGAFRFASLGHPSGGPLLIRMDGGGNIPMNFGVKVKHGKTSIVVGIKDPGDMKGLQRIATDTEQLSELHSAEWQLSPPKPTCWKVVSDPPEATAGRAQLGGLMDIALDMVGDAWPNTKIIGVDKLPITNLDDLMGMTWTRAVFELKCLYFKDGTVGVSRRLRELRVAPGQYYKVMTVEEIAAAPPGSCHSHTERIEDVTLTEDHIGAIVQDKARLVKLHHPKGGPWCVQLNGGGYIPQSFGVDESQPGKTYVSMTVADAAEDRHMRRIADEFLVLAEKHRDNWMPAIKSEQLGTNMHGLISDKKPKPDGEGSYDSMIKCLSEVSRLRTEPADDQNTLDLNTLKGARWASAVIEFRCVYVQGKQSFGIAKRLRYIELEDSNDSFVLPDSDDDM